MLSFSHMTTKVAFGEWLSQELASRNMRPVDLAKISGVSKAVISRALSGDRLPAADTLVDIARGLKVPPEKILEVAGVLPPKPKAENETQEFILLFQSLPPDKRKAVLEFLRFQHSGAGVISPAPRVKTKIEH